MKECLLFKLNFRFVVLQHPAKSIISKITATIFFAIGCFVNVQAQQCEWEKEGIGSGANFAMSNVTDANGNIYVTGWYSSPSLIFGATTLLNTSISPASQNIFLVKYDANGNVLWAKGFGGFGIDHANSIAIDASGDVYIYGNYTSAAISFGSTTLINSGADDNFLVKIDDLGNVIWAKDEKVADASFGCEATSVAVDISGNVIVSGYYDSSIAFGGTHVFDSSGSGGAYIAKYDPSGNVIWANTTYGNAVTFSKMSIDGYGNIYIAGIFIGSSMSFDTLTIIKPEPDGMFLAKYDSSGKALWGKIISDSCPIDFSCVKADKDGGVYLSGDLNCATITFDTIILTNTTGVSSSSNIYLVKYNKWGNVIWAKNVGGAIEDYIYTLDIDSSGNIIAGGTLLNVPVAFGTTTITKSGIFMAEYDSSGGVLWAKSGSNTNFGFINSIAIDRIGNIYAVGNFGDTLLMIDTCSLTRPSSAGQSIFTAKFNDIPEDVPIVEKQSNVLLFPNPARTELTVQSNNQKITQIIITNILGQKIFSNSYNAQQANIDVADLSVGIYFVKVNNSEVLKFVKE